MEQIDLFNASENLVPMYVFHIAYRKCSKMNNHWYRKFKLESTPFYHREVCAGAMSCNVSELKAKGYEVTSYYIERVMVPDVEQQF